MHPVPWFLATTPSSSPEMLSRNAITRLLDEYRDGTRAILVAAPSGFGKTVAVARWATDRAQYAPGSVAWLTLTERMNDRSDVLRGMLTALLNAAGDDCEQFGRALAAVFDATDYDAAVAALTAIEPPHPVTVVVDDHQLARAVWPDTDVVDLVENGPRWLRFIFLTTDPVAPEWMRLRVQEQVAVIGAAELAFTRAEVEALAARVDVPVTARDVDSVMAATNGWPGAVRLILVSGGAEGFHADIDLTDYIATAVLARLRPDLAEFALHATVCPRVDESLAQALSGRADSGALLDDCVAAGLFIERIGSGKDAVYQWHSIFVRHCGEILRRRRPDDWKELNRLAARELARRYPLEAVEHAIRADDRAGCDIIADHWLELLLQSRSAALDHACVRLAEAFGEDPELLMIRSCCRAMAGDDVMAQLLLDRALAMAPTAETSRRLAFIADLTHILVSDDRDTMAAAAARAEAALIDREVVTPRVYACALFVLGWADSRLRRGPARGSALLEAAVHECTALGLDEVAQRARQNLAFALAHAGELGRAKRALRAATAPGDSAPELWLSHDGDGITTFTTGWIDFWCGEIETALGHFVTADASSGVGYPDTARMFLCFSASTLRDDDALDIAEVAVTRMPDVDTHGVPWVSYTTASRARIAEARGQHAVALELAASVVDSVHVPMVSAMMSGMCRRLGAVELAARLAQQALEPQVPGYIAVYALHTLAVIDWQRGDAAAAHRRMEQLLALAAPEQVRYQFIDNTDVFGKELLAAHMSCTAYRSFVEGSLLMCEGLTRHPPFAALTAREREVLAFLRTPMTMQEIADKMSVSVNTLKTHQRAIYRKLGAANRREAIARAGR